MYIQKRLEELLAREIEWNGPDAIKGDYSVICVDKFSNEDFLAGTYATAEEAIKEAKKGTAEAAPLASSSSIATVYYAYDKNGYFIGP